MNRGVKPKVLPKHWIIEIKNQIQKATSLDFSIDLVARKLKMTKGSFYNYFDSKDEAISKAIEYWIQEEDKVLSEQESAPPQNIYELVLRFFQAVSKYKYPIVFFLVCMSKQKPELLRLAQKIQTQRFARTYPVLKMFGVPDEKLDEVSAIIVSSLIGISYIEAAKLFKIKAMKIDSKQYWKIVSESTAESVCRLLNVDSSNFKKRALN